MKGRGFLVAGFMVTTLATSPLAETIAVKHIQRPMYRFMVARFEDGGQVRIRPTLSACVYLSALQQAIGCCEQGGPLIRSDVIVSVNEYE